MSTTLSIVAVTTANIAAQQAAEAARVAKTAECKQIINSYDAKNASVAQAQTYGECVQFVYPKPSEPYTGFEIVAIKVCIVILLLGTIAGGVWGWKEDGPMFGFLSAFMGAAVAAAGIGAIWLASIGLAFLFS